MSTKAPAAFVAFAKSELNRLHDEGIALRAEIAELRSALSGLFNNSGRADWPDDLYDAAELALKNSARAADAAIR